MTAPEESIAAEVNPCAYHQLSSAPRWMVQLAQVRSYVRARGLAATFRKVAETLGLASKAPAAAPKALRDGEVLGLQRDEWVEVKSAEEIKATLDDFGSFRGLYFMDEMYNFCGRRFRVLKRMERLMVEATGRMRTIKHTVLLDGTWCDGTAHSGCDANCHHLWREMWLRRVEDPQQ